MGLDGISVNQLRSISENNSAELNTKINSNSNNEPKAINGLAEGQKVDPDKEKNKDRTNQNNSNEDTDDNTDIQDSDTEETIKYDLSKSDKYSLEIDETTDEINIVEKSSKKIVQKISAEELSNMAVYLINSQGSIINKRY